MFASHLQVLLQRRLNLFKILRYSCGGCLACLSPSCQELRKKREKVVVKLFFPSSLNLLKVYHRKAKARLEYIWTELNSHVAV